jgi:hypothetical protein
MRTKILLIAVATFALGIASSSAQTVYSANVVGYCTIQLTNGYTMVANQMDVDGTGVNNSIYSCLGSNLPNSTIVEVWNGAGFAPTKWSLGSHKWSVNNQTVTNAMQPGNGFFVSSAVQTNFIEVGTVIQGTNVAPVTVGYQVVAPNVPLTGGIRTALGYNPSKGDIVEIWNGAGFAPHKWSGSAWSGGGEPVFSIGQAMFLSAVSNNVWTHGFTVQP